MDLFQIVNKHAYPSVHALLIEPFKSMWEEDTSTDKEECIKDFTYIELMCSPKRSNPYFGTAEEERAAKVNREVYKDENHLLSSRVLEATMKYQQLLEHSSPAYIHFKTAVATAEKLRKFLDGLNPDARTSLGGSLLLKPKEILAAIKEVPSTMEELENARKRVGTELEEDSKTRNNREIGHYEE